MEGLIMSSFVFCTGSSILESIISKHLELQWKLINMGLKARSSETKEKAGQVVRVKENKGSSG